MKQKIILRLIGVVIAYSLFILAKILPHDINMALSQKHPIIVINAFVGVIGWLCGVTGVILLLLARPGARWFLTAYFTAGLTGHSAAWVPFTSTIFKGITSPYTKVVMFHFINLCLLASIFILFNKLRRSNNRLDGRPGLKVV